MGFEIQKACLKILAVCCYNHALNADLALFKVGFYKPVWLCVGEIQHVVRHACAQVELFRQDFVPVGCICKEKNEIREKHDRLDAKQQQRHLI